jgi:8-oxo-dGTP diphosphatase
MAGKTHETCGKHFHAQRKAFNAEARRTRSIWSLFLTIVFFRVLCASASKGCKASIHEGHGAKMAGKAHGICGEAFLTSAKLPTEVAVGIVYNSRGEVLFAQRPPGKPYAGWWEFPGGKVEAGETVHAALTRELNEELGLQVQDCRSWITREHVYPHATVRLHFCKVHAFDGQPQSLEGQAFIWDDAQQPSVDPILPAALPILPWLALPDVLHMPASSIAVILSGPLDASAFDRLPQRPDGSWSAALVAAKQEIEACAARACDFMLLGPVLPRSAADRATALGWSALPELISGTPIPVYLFGGLQPEDLGRAHRIGAHGIVC